MTTRRRYRVLATLLALAGGALSLAGFLAARHPTAARIASTSGGLPALAIGLGFTAIAVLVVHHYGRRSAQLAAAYHDLHRATLQRERSEAALRESERFIRATLDAMDAMIAVLDADGVVMAVNRGWRSSTDALAGRAGQCDVGANYVLLCEGLSDDGGDEARDLADGLRAVMAGRRDGLVLERHVAGERRAVLTHITRFPGHGPLRVLVAHQDVVLRAPAPGAEGAQADDALRAGEQRFWAMAESLAAGIVVVDGRGRCLYANPQWDALAGLGGGETLGAGWERVLHPDDRDHLLAGWRDAAERRGTHEAEVRVRTGSGDRWLHVLATALGVGPWGEGVVAGLAIEVTQRRVAEDAARVHAAELGRRVEERTRERDRFLALAHDLLCTVEAGRFILVNPAFTDVLGHPTADLLARPYLDLVHPDDRDAMARLGAAAGSTRVESRIRHRDGSWRWIAWTAIAEAPDLVHATGRDVSALRAADEALRRSADELRDLYDRAPCGYHSLDERGVLVAMNETGLAWLGYTREELAGRARFADLLTPESRRVFEESFPRFKERGRMPDLELDVVRKDGTILPVVVSATTVTDAEGRYLHSRSTLFDATERRQAAERMAALDAALATRAVELARADRELEVFSHAVSYDLRLPLRAIDGGARMLDEQGGKLGAGGQRHVATIRDNAHRMAGLIDALLDVARLGRQPVARATVDMTALAQAIAAEARRLAADREVAITVDRLAPTAGDATLIRRLVANLVANAIESTAAVRHACVDIGSVDHEGTPVYYVRDNGAGLDMQQVGERFDAFEPQARAGDWNGAGVGLAVVRRIVEHHGGRVWAEGRPGEGATYFFTLGPDAVFGELPAAGHATGPDVHVPAPT